MMLMRKKVSLQTNEAEAVPMLEENQKLIKQKSKVKSKKSNKNQKLIKTKSKKIKRKSKIILATCFVIMIYKKI